MHLLLGALVGAILSTAITVVFALVTRRKLRLHDVLLAAASGALGGAITAATLGLGAAAVAPTLGREVGAMALGGAVAGGTERAGHNAVEGRALHDGVLEEAAIGGAAGGAFPVARNAVAPVARKVVAGVRSAADDLGRALSRPGRDVPVDAVRTSGIVHALDADAARGGARGTSSTSTVEPTPTTTVTNATTPTTTSVTTTPATTTVTTAPRPSSSSWDEVMERGAARGYRSVHAPVPAWLEARIASTVDAVRRGAAGPAARPEDVEHFLRETAEHVDEVNALVRALGGRPREVPTTLREGADVLRGIHDFGERASLRRVEELVASFRTNPLRDRDGVLLEVPDWLARLVRDARARGETTIDVGKLSPHVAAGLGRAGPPDPFAIRLHNLSGHHHALEASATGRRSAALIESIADRVNAMRQARIYRPEPMPFEKIESIILDDVAAGRLPPEAAPLVRRAVELQGALEREGRVVNPYHLLESAPSSPASRPMDAALGAPAR